MLCNVKCTACTVWAAFCGSILCKSVKLTEPPDAEPHVRWCERSAAKAASYSIIICIGWKIGSFFDHLDLQIIKFDMFNKLILSKTGFGVKLEIVDIRVQPDRFA